MCLGPKGAIHVADGHDAGYRISKLVKGKAHAVATFKPKRPPIGG